MTDISNKTLAILLVVAVSLSILGIFASNKSGTPILGAVTNITAGTANVTINTVTQITLVNKSIDFGTGFVNSSANSCTLISNQTNAQTSGSAACQGFNQPAQSAAFVVENNGNAVVSLDINGSYANPRAFLCNAAFAIQNCTFAEPQYNRSAENQEASSCTDGAPVQITNGFGTGFNRVMNTTTQRICTSFSFNSASDSIQVKLRLDLPRDSRIGTLNDTVSFIATS